jgi:polysaccharide export outer membrane protein
MAVCKTQGELKDTITTLYKNYLRNPFVNVRVSDQRSQAFGVVGAVHKPGTFYLNRPVRLYELLTLAGGQDVEFAGGKIKLARLGNVSGCQENSKTTDEDVVFLSYRLNDIVEGKVNPWMKPGDIISVLKSEEAYVVGNVFKPAKVPLNDPVTLTQAIAIAGGLDATAKTDKVIIERQATENSPKTDLVFNLKDIRDKKIPDPQLQANDIVNVGNDKIKSLSKGLMKILTGALPNAVYRIP